MHTIVIAGAGGFIGGALVHTLARLHPDTTIRAVDKKPLPEWHRLPHLPNTECLCLDLAQPDACHIATRNATEVYNLAADMGGMGYISNYRIACMRNVLINTNLIEAAYRAGASTYFFASSACVYNTALQADPNAVALKESDAYPALAERGYGWEKLYAEMLCQEYYHERGLRTYIARFHNIYGPYGTWRGGREKAPAALCRKALAVLHGDADHVPIWGDGTQERSYTYIDDCITGILKIVACPALIATPVNLGSDELISVNGLLDIIEAIAQPPQPFARRYEPAQPTGVQRRNSDNTFIRATLDWAPGAPIAEGLSPTYTWIAKQYNQAGQAGGPNADGNPP
ncbi:MAG: NAD-dependent epimerase/dehydratase family protein [bacterium]